MLALSFKLNFATGQASLEAPLYLFLFIYLAKPFIQSNLQSPTVIAFP